MASLYQGEPMDINENRNKRNYREREREQRKMPQSFTQFLLKINSWKSYPTPIPQHTHFFFLNDWVLLPFFFSKQWRHKQGWQVLQKYPICHEPDYFCSPFVKSKPTWLCLEVTFRATHTQKCFFYMTRKTKWSMHVNTYKHIFKPDCIFGFSQSPTEALLQMASLTATTSFVSCPP